MAGARARRAVRAFPLLFAALLLAGCASPSQPALRPAATNATSTPAPTGPSSPPASSAPTPSVAQGSPTSPGGPRHARAHAEGSWTASANGVGLLGTKPQKLAVPKDATSGTLYVSWTATGPTPPTVVVAAGGKVLWSRALAKSSDALTLSTSEVAAMRDGESVNVDAEGPAAAAQVAYAIDGDFVSP